MCHHYCNTPQQQEATLEMIAADNEKRQEAHREADVQVRTSKTETALMATLLQTVQPKLVLTASVLPRSKHDLSADLQLL